MESDRSLVYNERKLRTMSSYVPQFIQKDLLVDPKVPVDPCIASFPSCILFIDVSGTRNSSTLNQEEANTQRLLHLRARKLMHTTGFTALNERLGKLGRGGPEQVSKHLNAYFGQLIDAVNDHGGDVLKVCSIVSLPCCIFFLLSWMLIHSRADTAHDRPYRSSSRCGHLGCWSHVLRSLLEMHSYACSVATASWKTKPR